MGSATASDWASALPSAWCHATMDLAPPPLFKEAKPHTHTPTHRHTPPPHTHTQTHRHTHTHTYTCKHTYARTHTCSTHTCKYTHVQIHTHTHTHTHMQVHIPSKHRHTNTHTHTHRCTHAHRHIECKLLSVVCALQSPNNSQGKNCRLRSNQAVHSASKQRSKVEFSLRAWSYHLFSS